MAILDINGNEKHWTVTLQQNPTSKTKYVNIPKDIVKIVKLEKGETIFIGIENATNKDTGKRFKRIVLFGETDFEASQGEDD